MNKETWKKQTISPKPRYSIAHVRNNVTLKRRCSLKQILISLAYFIYTLILYSIYIPYTGYLGYPRLKWHVGLDVYRGICARTIFLDRNEKNKNKTVSGYKTLPDRVIITRYVCWPSVGILYRVYYNGEILLFSPRRAHLTRGGWYYFL